MKKVLVIFSILLVAAACGGAASGGGTASSNYTSRGAGQAPIDSSGSQSSKSVAQPNGTTTVPGQTVPILQGPPVIRTAQLSITVGSGLFDSKLQAVRTLVESEGGYIAGTDAQASPTDTPESTSIRTGSSASWSRPRISTTASTS